MKSVASEVLLWLIVGLVLFIVIEQTTVAALG